MGAATAVRVYSPRYDLPPGAVRATRGASLTGRVRSSWRPMCSGPSRSTADLVADMRQFQPQVVHLATEFAMGYPGLRASKALGLPIIASSHTDYEAYARPYGRWLVTAVRPGWAYMRWFYRHAHKVLCPTRVTRRISMPAACMHTGIWTRGVNAEEFNPRFRSDAWRARFGVGPNDALVTFVGRIAPEKNLEMLLDAWQRLAPVRGNAQLTLVGDGLLVESIRRRDTFPACTCSGTCTASSSPPPTPPSDVFAFPSGTETFGNVMLEAMASGTAPVCVNVGGPSDYGIR